MSYALFRGHIFHIITIFAADPPQAEYFSLRNIKYFGNRRNIKYWNYGISGNAKT